MLDVRVQQVCTLTRISTGCSLSSRSKTWQNQTVFFPNQDIFTTLNLQLSSQTQGPRLLRRTIFVSWSFMFTSSEFPADIWSSLYVLIFRVKLLIAQESKPTLPNMERGINATSVTNTKGMIFCRADNWEKGKDSIFLPLICFLQLKSSFINFLITRRFCKKLKMRSLCCYQAWKLDENRCTQTGSSTRVLLAPDQSKASVLDVPEEEKRMKAQKSRIKIQKKKRKKTYAIASFIDALWGKPT